MLFKSQFHKHLPDNQLHCADTSEVMEDVAVTPAVADSGYGHPRSGLKCGYRTLALAVCALSIVGCQNTPTQTSSTQLITTTPINAWTNNVTQDSSETIATNVLADANYLQAMQSNQQAFADMFAEGSSVANDEQARARLMQAIDHHLSHDYVAVVNMRQQDVPFISKDSIDYGSTSLLKTILDNVIDGSEGDSSEDYADAEDLNAPFSTEEEYLSEPDAPYLNYADEYLLGRYENEDGLTRQEGMSDEYAQTSQDIMSYIYDTHDCVGEYMGEFEDLLYEWDGSSPAKSHALMANYQACLSNQKAAAKLDMLTREAVSYQRHYLSDYQTCVSNFNRRIDTLLKTANLADEDESTSYYPIAESYQACYDSISYAYELEPIRYIAYGLTVNELDYNYELKSCADNLVASQQALEGSGSSVTSDLEIFEMNIEDKTSCDDTAFYTYMASESEYDETAEWEESPSGFDMIDIILGKGGVSGSRSETLSIIKTFLEAMHLSPEQVEAQNLYINQNLNYQVVREYKASSKQVNNIYGYDFMSPTLVSSMQIPVGFDFDKGEAKVDASAIMPLVAMMSSEHTPLPEDMSSPMLRFYLPEEITSETVPTSVLFDVFVESLTKSMSELSSSNFTAVDISQDDYGKQIGASSAVKVNLGGKQTGQLIGSLLKHMEAGLSEYLKAHPEEFGDDKAISQIMTMWAEMSQKYQTHDAGTILQLIETVVPVTFDNVNTYYLDSRGQLIAKQVSSMVGSDLMGTQSTIIEQTRYDRGSFAKHPYAQLFNESFGAAAKPAVDGNQWLANISEERKMRREAEGARWDYEYQRAAGSGDDDSSFDEYDNEVGEDNSKDDSEDYNYDDSDGDDMVDDQSTP